MFFFGHLDFLSIVQPLACRMVDEVAKKDMIFENNLCAHLAKSFGGWYAIYLRLHLASNTFEPSI
jgi:hypothetical protein